MADGNTSRDGFYLCIIVIKVARIDQDQINGEANVPFVIEHHGLCCGEICFDNLWRLHGRFRSDGAFPSAASLWCSS